LSSVASGRRGGLVSSASLTLATKIAAFAFSLATNVILARSLGPEGRGVYAVAVLIPALIGLFSQLGIGQANVFYFSKRLLDADELIGHAFSLALVLGAAGYLAVSGYVVLSGAREFAGIGSSFVLVSCLSLPFTLLVIFLQGILNGAQRYRLWNSVLLTQYASPTVTLAVAMIAFRASTMAAVAAWTASCVITAAVAAFNVASLGRFSLRLRIASLKLLLRFGLVGYLGSLTSFVNYRFDVLIVNLFAGARQVGLYAVGTGLAEIVWYLANAAGIVLAPKVAESKREQGDRMTEAVCRVVTLLALVAGVVLAAIAPFVVVLFFGEAFAESVWAVWLLLPGIVTFSVARVLSMYLLGRNQLKFDLLASACGLVMTLVLDLVLIPRFGFRGAAVASTIAYTCAMAVDLFFVTRTSSITLRGLLVATPPDVRLLWRRIRELAAFPAKNRGEGPRQDLEIEPE
jgi:O-antigen/teichoic acid export membrane protein